MRRAANRPSFIGAPGSVVASCGAKLPPGVQKRALKPTVDWFNRVIWRRPPRTGA